MSSNVDVTRNFVNSLINQQIAEKKFGDALKQNSLALQKMAALNAKPNEDSSLFDELSQVLDKAQYEEPLCTDPNLLNAVDKLINSGVNANIIANLLVSLSGDTDDILYTRTDSYDPNITLQNKMKFMGGDLYSFLNQVELVNSLGYDVNAYVETATNVFSQSDYDDFRRFIDLTGTILKNRQDPSGFFDFANKVAQNSPETMESNFFTIQTLLTYNPDIEKAVRIMNNMVTDTSLTGRENMAKVNAFIVACYKKGYDANFLIDQMADSGNTIGFINSWAALHGMRFVNTRHDTGFDRIEGIDTRKAMVIKQGENAALFAQAVSSTDGVIDAKYLYWSSVQTGALSNGSNYLDLSKLPPGEYDIFVKVGNYGNGTDTARRKVIILANDDNSAKENNGLGDMKDSDNTSKGIDLSNPGHNKDDLSEPEHNSKIIPPPFTPPLTPPLPPVKQSSPEDLKAEKIREMYSDFMSENQEKDFFNGPLTLEKFVDLLNKVTSKKEEGGEDNWLDKIFEAERNSELYRKALLEIIKYINKQLDNKAELTEENNKKELEEKKLFQEYLNLVNVIKENNGLGDQKDSDNIIKGIDASNPGQNNNVSEKAVNHANNVKIM